MEEPGTYHKTGVYHNFNVLKFKILKTLYDVNPKRLTAFEIAERLEVSDNSIRVSLRRWRAKGMTIIRRSQKRNKNKEYEYKITKQGIKVYLDFKNRINKGLSLKRLGPPKKARTYMNVRRCERSVISIANIDWSLSKFMGKETKLMQDVMAQVAIKLRDQRAAQQAV